VYRRYLSNRRRFRASCLTLMPPEIVNMSAHCSACSISVLPSTPSTTTSCYVVWSSRLESDAHSADVDQVVPVRSSHSKYVTPVVCRSSRSWFMAYTSALCAWTVVVSTGVLYTPLSCSMSSLVVDLLVIHAQTTRHAPVAASASMGSMNVSKC